LRHDVSLGKALTIVAAVPLGTMVGGCIWHCIYSTSIHHAQRHNSN